LRRTVTNLDQRLPFVGDVGTPNLKLRLNASHTNLEEADMPAAIRRARALLMNTRGPDSNRKAPGRGHTDVGGLTLAFHDAGYRGALVSQLVFPGADPPLVSQMSAELPLQDVYAQDSIRYRKEVRRSVGSAR
jgi:sugar phosphate isomerase/epimerase